MKDLLFFLIFSAVWDINKLSRISDISWNLILNTLNTKINFRKLSLDQHEMNREEKA